MSSAIDSAALVQHLVAQTRNNISFLISQNQIPPTVGQEILDRLPPAGRNIPDPITALSNQASNIRISAPSPSPPSTYNSREFSSSTVKAKALWGYNENGEDPQDLAFRAGDIIEIVQETNSDWWTGRHHGREGLFPSNYVEKLPPSSSSLSRPPPPPVRSSPAPSYTSGYKDSSRPPAAPQPSYPQSFPPPVGPPSGAYGAPPPGGYYQSPPPPPGGGYSYGPPPPGPVVVSASAPPPADAPKQSRFGGMGNTLATAAVGGLGFGAGSAIGSDVVNSIF